MSSVPARVQTVQPRALLAFGCIRDAIGFLGQAQRELGATLGRFDMVSGTVLHKLLADTPGQTIPLESADYPWVALVGLSPNAQDTGNGGEHFGAVLATAFEDGLLADAGIAETAIESLSLQKLSQGLTRVTQPSDGVLSYQLDLPLPQIPAFLNQAAAALQTAFPGAQPQVFGPLAKGRLYYQLGLASVAGPDADDTVHALLQTAVEAHQGAIRRTAAAAPTGFLETP